METNRRSAGGGWSPATLALPIIAAFLLAVLLLFGASDGSRDGVYAQDPDATETPKPQKSDHECDDDPSLASCPPPPPWGISLSFSDDDLTINYRRSAWQGSSGHSYRFELSRSTRRTGGYSTHATINDSIPPANRYNLDKGYWYRVRGKRCHGSSCGAWSSYSFPKWLAPPPTATFTPTPKATATPVPPPPPRNLRATLFGGDDVRVNYSRSYWSGSSSHYYRFEMEQFDVGTKDYDFYRRVDDSASPAYFRNLEVGNSYRVRGKRCTSSSRATCGKWSNWREIGVYPASDTHAYRYSDASSHGDAHSDQDAYAESDGYAHSYAESDSHAYGDSNSNTDSNLHAHADSHLQSDTDCNTNQNSDQNSDGDTLPRRDCHSNTQPADRAKYIR